MQKLTAELSADRPEPDGELTPTVTFVDELLASDKSEEPPMRDASGELVEVRVQEPWALHELNSDTTNNTAADGGDVMKAPAEPGLVRLTPVAVNMVIERYVRWLIVKKNKEYFGQLPNSHIDALMQLSPSLLPVARAINTAPLISRSGAVIDGAGLDRKTGLVHRIDPLLRACLPERAPTEQDVRDALTFLLREWLVDVALDDVGKCQAIMLAMTLIERALLTERPAFFVVAAQRGGGKTTLVNMITLAALGRRAAAAAWSDTREERKKALFSYLRQGVACLAWDNIPRGATITCPHIEAALTAAEISDRVLGVSRVETVPSTTVQIFTGNAIGPRGDMTSRSLMLALNVDRPDPENRSFVHPDPLAWTRAHRREIVQSTLCAAGRRCLEPPAEPGGEDPVQGLVDPGGLAHGVRRGPAWHQRRLHRADARRRGRGRGGFGHVGGADHPARDLGRRTASPPKTWSRSSRRRTSSGRTRRRSTKPPRRRLKLWPMHWVSWMAADWTGPRRTKSASCSRSALSAGLP